MRLESINTFFVALSVLFILCKSESNSDSIVSGESYQVIDMLVRMSEQDQKNVISEEIGSASSQHPNSTEKLTKRSKPTKYMMFLLKDMESNPLSDPQNGNGETVSFKIQDRTIEKPRDSLFYAWIPNEIIDMNAGRTTVVFQQTIPRDYFGNFTAAQIVLTVLDDAALLDLDSTTQVSMYTHWKNEMFEQELLQTQSVVPKKKFYSFDIKEFIESQLQPGLTQPNFIRISFKIMVRHARSRIIDFKKLFDIQVDSPFMVFFYHDFLPREISTITTTATGTPKRKSRSLSDRPSTQCQRRNFAVYPEEVDWYNLVYPREIDLGYCSGNCPTPLQDHYYNITLHSFLLDRYRMQAMFNVPSDFPHSGCIPVTYKSISVLEETDTGVFKASKVHNISVATCGCRY